MYGVKIGMPSAIVSPALIVLAQRVEDIGHRRGAAFDREDVELTDERMLADHLAAQVLADDDLRELQHAIRHRVVRGQDAFAHFVQEIAGRQTQLIAHV
jgi:hypothetical protein